MAVLDEALLEAKLTELEQQRSWSPRVVSKLENFLRGEDEWALFRANPFQFAEERGVSPDEAVDLFLYASRVGLFGMTWCLVCPGCGGAVESFSTLRSVCATFHCHLCSTDVETKLDDFVHVGFTVSPKIRRIPAHDPGSLSAQDLYLKYYFTREARIFPGGPVFANVVGQTSLGIERVPPHGSRKFDLDLAPGALVVHEMAGHAMFALPITPSAPSPNPPLTLRLQDGIGVVPEIPVGPGRLEMTIVNDGAENAPVLLFFKPQHVLDEMAKRDAEGLPNTMSFDRFLTGRRLLTCHTFRQIFGSEIIRSSDGIGVRDITVLFTDLKGSTAMYDRIGDLKAFALVNQHFDRLGRAIIRHHGAVVKTIGDAVMASFEQPADAMLAARDMLREIETFNDEVGEREIVLKVGVHRGASIAVTLNDRLDFFGQTINIAARVQGLADADEIFITDDVYRAPGVKDALENLHVTPQQAFLKGVQRAVNVYRVATGPSSIVPSVG